MAVARRWGLQLDEFEALPMRVRARYIADFNVENDPEGPQPARASGSWSRTPTRRRGA